LNLGIHVAGSPDAKVLKISYDQMKIDLDMPAPMSDQEFDSQNPDKGNPGISSFYSAMKENGSVVLVDGRGCVKEVRGTEKLTSDNAVLARFLGGPQIRSLLEHGWLIALPVKPVAQGDSWAFKLHFPTPVGVLQLKGNYTRGGSQTVDGVPCQIIEMNGTIDGKINGSPAEGASGAKGAPAPPGDSNEDAEVQRVQATLTAMGMKIETASVQGKIYYDAQRCHIRKSEVETNVRIGVAKYPENGKPAEIPLTQKVSYTLDEAAAGR
jgi:hypothetical protein